MSSIDWLIIGMYMLAMIALGFYLGRNQRDIEAYYVGERKFKWWMVGISTMATQTSAISFISIPAFVALKQNGGLSWLQYELAVPLATIVIMVFLIPFFRQLQLVSIYEYLERRFSAGVRLTVSLVFLVSRGLGTGIALYAAAIVLSVCSGLPLYATILLLGVATIIYDAAGGIRAVVYSDVIQMLVLVLGLLACVLYAAELAGGFGEIFNAMPAERTRPIEMTTGLGDAAQVPFWAFLIGGFFLYISYYGTDQSQAQRGLSAASATEAKQALLLNGLSRFPLTLLYVLLGVAMYAAYQHSPQLQSSVPAHRPDYLVPYFIVTELPAGLRGLLFAALLSATMSSLDSALNSLSAVTVRDFVEPRLRDRSTLFYLSKVITVAWGCLITGFAFVVGDISDTVIEGINKIGSAFYGPVLATFLLAITARRVHAAAAICGIVAGVSTNIVLWTGFENIHWMWWNLFGFAAAAGVALTVSMLKPAAPDQYPPDLDKLTLTAGQIAERERGWWPVYGLLLVYFVAILSLLLMLN